jgi:methionyl-tRNA formyltransferase
MRIVFMGTPEAAVPSLRRIVEDGHRVVAVWTQPDKPAGRGNKLTAPPVKLAAQLLGLPVYQPAKIRTPEAKELFASHDADLAVVVAYGRILPAEILQAPRLGCVNVHFSLLPKYRGAAPVNWAIVKGEEKTGVTTMHIEEELDSGPILLQREVTIAPKETAPELMLRLADLGAELLGETLKKLSEIIPQPQRSGEATFAPILKRTDGQIDWSSSAATIERGVRGFQPWPNAYTHDNAQKLIIWKAEPSTMDTEAPPGEIIVAHGDELIVKCGDGTALRLVELQGEGKRRIGVRDYINGTHHKAGDRFD